MQPGRNSCTLAAAVKTAALAALLSGALAALPGGAGAADPNAITDPDYPFQWPLNNVGQTFPPNCETDPSNGFCRTATADADIDWAEAYAAGATGAGVVIALGSPCVASGGTCGSMGPTVSCDHPDLVGRLWVNPGESGGGKETNGVDDDGNGFVDDVHGANLDSGDGNVCLSGTSENHDTDVARLAVASVDGTGAVGVAPEAQLMLVAGWADAANETFFENGGALDYAEQNGARVMIVPYAGFGGPIASSGACANVADPPGPGIKRDDILAASAVLVVWGFPNEYPGCDPSAVGLMPTDHGDFAFANPPNSNGSPPSPFMDLAAPGDRAWIRNLALSWAIPVVGGVSALALQHNPGLTRAELLARLRDGADKVGSTPYDGNGWNDTYGYGRLNAYETVLLGDLDSDGVDGDGDGSGVAGDAVCPSGQSAGCDDSCPFDADSSQQNDDADLLGNVCDNCAGVTNPGQEDAGGLFGPVADGVGDACQCGDASGDGQVDAADVSAAQLCMLGTGPCLATCDADASGACDAGDPPSLESALAGSGSLGCILP
jgi:hypothetical protein